MYFVILVSVSEFADSVGYDFPVASTSEPPVTSPHERTISSNGYTSTSYDRTSSQTVDGLPLTLLAILRRSTRVNTHPRRLGNDFTKTPTAANIPHSSTRSGDTRELPTSGTRSNSNPSQGCFSTDCSVVKEDKKPSILQARLASEVKHQHTTPSSQVKHSHTTQSSDVKHQNRLCDSDSTIDNIDTFLSPNAEVSDDFEKGKSTSELDDSSGGDEEIYRERTPRDIMRPDVLGQKQASSSKKRKKMPSGTMVQSGWGPEFSDYSHEYRIKQRIMMHYDKNTRPVRNDTTRTTIVIGMSLYHILDTVCHVCILHN